jgi:hypothetical protein
MLRVRHVRRYRPEMFDGWHLQQWLLHNLRSSKYSWSGLHNRCAWNLRARHADVHRRGCVGHVRAERRQRHAQLFFKFGQRLRRCGGQCFQYVPVSGGEIASMLDGAERHLRCWNATMRSLC